MSFMISGLPIRKTLGLRGSETAFPAHHSTRIEIHEQHQLRLRGRSVAPRFGVGIGGGVPAPSGTPPCQVGAIDASSAATTVSNGLDA